MSVNYHIMFFFLNDFVDYIPLIFNSILKKKLNVNTQL